MSDKKLPLSDIKVLEFEGLAPSLFSIKLTNL